MSQPATPMLRSRPSTSWWARRHTSLLHESDLNHTSLSSCHGENTSKSCTKPPSPPLSRQPSLQRPRSPTPDIMLSGWQPVEPSPALWVFLRNVPSPPSAPEFEVPSEVRARAQQQAEEQARAAPLQTEGDGSRRDSVVDEEMLPRAGRNGGEIVRGVNVDVESQEERVQKSYGGEKLIVRSFARMSKKVNQSVRCEGQIGRRGGSE
ncbi:hypothetical protein COCMIDRAFT_24691 [Bipolaris oryzae ATCC 44560]|uniref:Uncharacterized protein n=1 Tax=Bipolaris oryzae ATCC 44560 TaxID=930090 RepID=W6ZUF4_COCMI|nr:uncharacterized protein COCMIDRAFT_24691 [Bipolaris oryzae ATCC 44560]EUC47366.1 hypothetical protein COCMIDRAFT_24691 [Bipolaris oryzae ATCC 44560]